MCQASPGEIIEVDPHSDPVMAKVSFSGLVRKVSLGCVPQAKVGDFVIVHAGFAINTLDQAEALRTLELIRQGKESS